jgi:hypothetical protein
MVIVFALSLAVGLLGGWVYAGCPLPPKPAAARKPAVADEAVPAPVPSASTARP